MGAPYRCQATRKRSIVVRTDSGSGDESTLGFGRDGKLRRHESARPTQTTEPLYRNWYGSSSSPASSATRVCATVTAWSSAICASGGSTCPVAGSTTEVRSPATNNRTTPDHRRRIGIVNGVRRHGALSDTRNREIVGPTAERRDHSRVR